MSKIQLIFYVISACIGIMTAAIPSAIALCKTVKSRFEAKTAKEKAEADLAIKTQMIALIPQVEKLYEVADLAIKGMGGSTGSVKKETVMARLQQFALDNGYVFDRDKWSTEIDDTVAMTRLVNSK